MEDINNEKRDWIKAKKRIEEIPDNCRAGKSDRKNLATVFAKSEKWGIDPLNAEKSSMSNLRRILKDAQSAIRHNEKEKLVELFQWAAELNVAQLRLTLGSVDLETIVFQEIIKDGEVCYVLMLKQHQFDRIKRSTQLQLKFVNDDNNV